MNAAQVRAERTLSAALDSVEREVPGRVARGIQWLRGPRARWLRVPLGLMLIAASFFWFLPIIGIEFLPLGLLLIAIDVPWLRRPVGLAVLWLARSWRRVKRRWSRKDHAGKAP